MSAGTHLCNLCGLSTAPNDPDAGGDPHGLAWACATGSYASTPGNGGGALDDLTRYSFALCEWCLDWIFSRCAIPPDVADIGIDGSVHHKVAFRPAARRVAEDDWRKMKDKFFAEKKLRDAARDAAALRKLPS